nr:MAG TPA: hypothetical protein [Caudoviricetes sp.]
MRLQEILQHTVQPPSPKRETPTISHHLSRRKNTNVNVESQ